MAYAAVPAGTPAAAANLLLQLCTDRSNLPLTPQHITTLNPAAAPSAPGSAGFTTPSKTPSSNSRTAAPASSSKKSSKKGSASKAGQQQQNDSSSSSGGVKQGDVAVQWQLRLLQGGIDWSNIKHRQLLQQLAHRQLLGRALLQGVQLRPVSHLLPHSISQKNSAL
jgi:hypothetical protein